MPLTFGSVTSGIEAASVAWNPLGWKAAWLSEIEPFPCRLLKHHYPSVPNLGDMLKIRQNEIFKSSTIDVLVGGTPCQSFSTAGLRRGLADGRGNLSLEFCRLLIEKRPRWFVWENVPGVLSSFSNVAEGPDLSGTGYENGADITETADFGTLLDAFRECGYTVAFRIFDAQFFGIPQRRRRVFVVGHIGNDWRPPTAVLFDPESLRRNPAKGGPSGKDIARAVTAGARKADRGEDGNLIVVNTLDTRYGEKHGASNQDIRTGCPHLVFHPDPCSSWWDGGQVSQTLDAVLHKGQTMPEKNRFPAVIQFGGVRRLTPLECERLQGFPDHYTRIPGAKNSPRYKAIGNSMPVPVMAYIGGRIQKVENILNSLTK